MGFAQQVDVRDVHRHNRLWLKFLFFHAAEHKGVLCADRMAAARFGAFAHALQRHTKRGGRTKRIPIRELMAQNDDVVRTAQILRRVIQADHRLLHSPFGLRNVFSVCFQNSSRSCPQAAAGDPFRPGVVRPACLAPVPQSKKRVERLKRGRAGDSCESPPGNPKGIPGRGPFGPRARPRRPAFPRGSPRRLVRVLPPVRPPWEAAGRLKFSKCLRCIRWSPSP